MKTTPKVLISSLYRTTITAPHWKHHYHAFSANFHEILRIFRTEIFWKSRKMHSHIQNGMKIIKNSNFGCQKYRINGINSYYCAIIHKIAEKIIAREGGARELICFHFFRAMLNRRQHDGGARESSLNPPPPSHWG